MNRPSNRGSKLRRISVVAAAVALVASLTGCVIYPAGPGYGYYHPYYFHFDHDHDRGWH